MPSSRRKKKLLTKLLSWVLSLLFLFYLNLVICYYLQKVIISLKNKKLQKIAEWNLSRCNAENGLRVRIPNPALAMVFLVQLKYQFFERRLLDFIRLLIMIKFIKLRLWKPYFNKLIKIEFYLFWILFNISMGCIS